MHDDGHVIGNRLVGSQGVFSVIESLYMVKHQEHWNISYIIIYLYKIVILHHGMQSFHNNRLLHACLLHARLLHGCDVTHISSIGRFATSISLREHANERYAECLGMNWCSKHLIIINNPTQNDLFTEIDNFIEVYNNSVIELIQCFGTSFFGRIDHLASSVIKFRPKNSVPKHCIRSITYNNCIAPGQYICNRK